MVCLAYAPLETVGYSASHDSTDGSLLVLAHHEICTAKKLGPPFRDYISCSEFSYANPMLTSMNKLPLYMLSNLI